MPTLWQVVRILLFQQQGHSLRPAPRNDPSGAARIKLMEDFSGGMIQRLLFTFTPGRAKRAALQRLIDAWIGEAESGEELARHEAGRRIARCYRNNAAQLDLQRLQLTSLPNCLVAMSTLLQLDASHNQLEQVPELPAQLSALCVQDNKIRAFSALPMSLRELKATRNRLQRLPSLPPNLKLLQVGRNELTALPSLPSSLRSVDACRNRLTTLPVLPARLHTLAVAENRLTELPPLPLSGERLWMDVRGNQLIDLPGSFEGALRWGMFDRNPWDALGTARLSATPGATFSLRKHRATAFVEIRIPPPPLPRRYSLDIDGVGHNFDTGRDDNHHD